jgi:DNA-binding HxlR family transcriptional regulator
VKRASFSNMNCSVAKTLEIVGEWWTPLIVRDALFGVTRFDEFQERLGIARNVLAARLDTLVAGGVMERVPYDEARDRYDYVLTDAGRALWPVLTALRQWGDDWLAAPDGPPVDLEHTVCGHRITARYTCDHCGKVLERDDLRSRPGPGSTDPGLLRPKARRAPRTGDPAPA